MSLSEQDREQLDEALWGGRIYDDVPLVVGQIVARHVAAALEQAADAIEAVDPVEWALAGQSAGTQAADIVRAQIHN